MQAIVDHFVITYIESLFPLLTDLNASVSISNELVEVFDSIIFDNIRYINTYWQHMFEIIKNMFQTYSYSYSTVNAKASILYNMCTVLGIPSNLIGILFIEMVLSDSI